MASILPAQSWAGSRGVLSARSLTFAAFRAISRPESWRRRRSRLAPLPAPAPGALPAAAEPEGHVRAAGDHAPGLAATAGFVGWIRVQGGVNKQAETRHEELRRNPDVLVLSPKRIHPDGWFCAPRQLRWNGSDRELIAIRFRHVWEPVGGQENDEDDDILRLEHLFSRATPPERAFFCLRRSRVP